MSGFRASTGNVAVAALGAAFAAVAFGAKGGTELGRTTAVELALVLGGGGLAAAALLYAPQKRLHGGTVLALMAALAAVTGLSVVWSIAPELSFVEAGRMLAYLAVLAAAVGAARLWPGATAVLLKATLLGAAAVVAYALASRVWPGALSEGELSNRIGEPYGYWNAVGTTAALLVPAALWLGSRRGAGLLSSALAYPAMGGAMLAMLLSQSRGAVAAALIAAGIWFAVVPLRLRSLPVLIVPALAAAPVAAWALSKDAFSKSFQPLAVKESVAGEFGLLLLLMAAGLLLAGLGVHLALARSAPPVRLRRRVGVAAVAAACAVPLVLFTSVAFSDRGLGGTIEERVENLTSESAAQPPQGPGRLTTSSSTRAKYWREAGKVFANREWLGTGAGTFGISRLRYRKDELVSRHAHGFVPQTLADTGLLGLAVVVALLAAWLAAAARGTGLRPRLRTGAPPVRRDWTAERVALVAVALVPLAFGLQSLIDWTWFVPGPAVMALAGAGFVAGRGPLAGLAPEAAPSAPRAPERPRIVAAGAVLFVALLGAWMIWQPERSDRASNHALELVEEGDVQAAAGEARDAEDANPLSPKPLLVRASVQSAAGDDRSALRTLERAVLRFPGEPRTWLRLAEFQLTALDRPRAALETLRGALYLDPRSKAGRRLFLEARARLRAAP